MPLLNRRPETPFVRGLLVVLGLILLFTAVRYSHFFLHEVLRLR